MGNHLKNFHGVCFFDHTGFFNREGYLWNKEPLLFNNRKTGIK